MRYNDRIERRYQRYKTNAPVRVRVFIDESLVSTMYGRCRQIARGGLGCQLTDQLRIGETVLVQLSHAVSAYATVRYVRGFYHGFEFSLLKDAARSYIEKLCDQCEAELGPVQAN